MLVISNVNFHSLQLLLIIHMLSLKKKSYFVFQVLVMGAKEMLNYWYYKLFGSESLGEMKGKEEEDTEIESITLTQKKDEANGNTTFSECSEVSELQTSLIFAMNSVICLLLQIITK